MDVDEKIEWLNRIMCAGLGESIVLSADEAKEYAEYVKNGPAMPREYQLEHDYS